MRLSYLDARRQRMWYGSLMFEILIGAALFVAFVGGAYALTEGLRTGTPPWRLPWFR